ncbi:MAG: hypothetical protein HY909_26005 [Deltaproteobacteria bacterium]|nr:hypothetical protein [Deltaproteobacteria bacterium]
MPKPSKVPPNGAPPASGSNECPERPKRRTLPAAQKLAIVQAADACTERGEV